MNQGLSRDGAADPPPLAGLHSAAQVFWAMLTRLTGLAAVLQLWRRASSAFFRSAKALRSQPPSEISGS